MTKAALECVGSHVPSREEPKYWVTQRRLIRHAARCWDMMVKGVVKEDDIKWVLHSLGYLYSDQGHLDKAEEMYVRALQGYEKAWGPDHTSTLTTVNNLGTLYADQGKLDEAEKMYNRALRGYERALGRVQAKTYIPALNTMENLAGLLSD
jgi:tetratricopeptide (TPR) repeat protein